MGIGQNLKDLYFSLEDKYYALLDKVDKILPVYKIVDPIDKVFPSFILFIAVIALAVAGLIYFVPWSGLERAPVILKVTDSDGTALSGVTVYYRVNGASSSAETDAEGKIYLSLEPNSELDVLINGFSHSGKEFKAFERTYFVDRRRGKQCNSCFPEWQWSPPCRRRNCCKILL